MPYKIPESVLVVIYTPDLQVLLIERADRPGFWQSVTGSLDAEDEPLPVTAAREVAEETGIIASAHGLTDWQHTITYDIYPSGATATRPAWHAIPSTGSGCACPHRCR